MIYVVAELRLKPGMAEKAAAEARKVVAGTVKEDGCLYYDFHLSVSDPTRLVAVERWTSREALEALEDMLRGLGAQLTPLEAPFDPEAAAPHHHHEHDHGA